jgi:hypothetical protein
MLSVDRVSGAALAAFGVAVLWQSRALPLGTLGKPGPAYMPMVLGALIVVGGVALAVLGGDSVAARSLRFPEWRHVVAIVVACAFAALGLERLGYRLTIFLVVLFLLAAVERKRPTTAMVVAAVFAVGTFLLFDGLLRVRLPRGPLGF